MHITIYVGVAGKKWCGGGGGGKGGREGGGGGGVEVGEVWVGNVWMRQVEHILFFIIVNVGLFIYLFDKLGTK